MSELVIETSGLSKLYRSRGRRRAALDGLDLQVAAGEVHGLLGPNGAGKTTLMRLLVGLARPSRGTMRLFGRSVPEELPGVIGRVGALVEEPAFTDSASGRRNLSLLAKAGGLPGSAVGEALERVGLSGEARHHYGAYSLGMRQRLAVAATLMRRPDLLILDEPTNGLDPAGLRDVRTVIADLAAQGTTVLLSSHVLAEVQQLCSSVSILDEGRLVSHGSVDDLLGDEVSRTRLGISDPERAALVLERAGHRVHRTGEDLIVEGHEHPEELTRVLAGHGLYVRELTALRPTLESWFLEVTGHLPRSEDRRGDGEPPVDADSDDDPHGEVTGP